SVSLPDPPIAFAVPEMDEPYFFLAEEPHPLLPEVCENPVSGNGPLDQNPEPGEFNFGRGARSTAPSWHNTDIRSCRDVSPGRLGRLRTKTAVSFYYALPRAV